MERCSEIQMEMDSEIQEFPEIQPIPGAGIVSPNVLVRIEILRDSLLSTSQIFPTTSNYCNYSFWCLPKW